jgi:hypothetical protein
MKVPHRASWRKSPGRTESCIFAEQIGRSHHLLRRVHKSQSQLLGRALLLGSTYVRNETTPKRRHHHHQHAPGCWIVWTREHDTATDPSYCRYHNILANNRWEMLLYRYRRKIANTMSCAGFVISNTNKPFLRVAPTTFVWWWRRRGGHHGRLDGS